MPRLVDDETSIHVVLADHLHLLGLHAYYGGHTGVMKAWLFNELGLGLSREHLLDDSATHAKGDLVDN